MGDVQIGVSVVIPCYNSARLLPDTLYYLAHQDVPEHIRWEIIIVDNGSTDSTVEVANMTWKNLNSHVPFRIGYQQVKGTTAAREKGFQSALYEYVLFCDDDNWLHRDYIRIVYDIMKHNPNIGVAGGKGEGISDIQFPDWFNKYSKRFAIGPQGEETGDVTETRGWVYGAGFAVRRSAWMMLKNNGFQSLLTGRYGKGQDKELCFAIRLAGFRIWYDSRLTFKHFLTKDRFNWKNMLDLFEKQQYAVSVFSAYRYVLEQDDSEYIRPSRWVWMKKCLHVLRELLTRRMIKIMILSLYRDVEKELVGSAQIAKLRQKKGTIIGWLYIRTKFVELCDEINTVKYNVQKETQNGVFNFSTKNYN